MNLSQMIGRSAWIYVLASLPVFLVLDHAVYLRQVRNPFRGPHGTTPVSDDSAKRGLSRALAQNERYFSLGMVVLRLGLPAAVLGIVAVVVGYYLFPGGLVPGEWPRDLSEPYSGLFRAARYGAAGAYVYVLLNLGLRNFRQDITNGGVAWCTTTLALGPLLAWALAHFWTP